VRIDCRELQRYRHDYRAGKKRVAARFKPAAVHAIRAKAIAILARGAWPGLRLSGGDWPQTIGNQAVDRKESTAESATQHNSTANSLIYSRNAGEPRLGSKWSMITVRDLGVGIRCGVEVERDMPPWPEIDAGIRRDFVVGLGLGGGTRMNIQARICPMVRGPGFLETNPIRSFAPGASGQHGFAVIGRRANTAAIDAVTQAKRLGAEKAVLIFFGPDT